MRLEADRQRITLFIAALGKHVRGPGRVYLTGGATAVLEGWRTTTIDVDLKADPEPPGFFEPIAELKDTINLNVELASPADFLPELPGWRERSVFVQREGALDFYHYDFYSQALWKIERGHARDLDDVRAMFERRLLDRQQLWTLFQAIEPRLIRYPAIDPATLRRDVIEFCERGSETAS